MKSPTGRITSSINFQNVSVPLSEEQAEVVANIRDAMFGSEEEVDSTLQSDPENGLDPDVDPGSGPGSTMPNEDTWEDPEKGRKELSCWHPLMPLEMARKIMSRMPPPRRARSERSSYRDAFDDDTLPSPRS